MRSTLRPLRRAFLALSSLIFAACTEGAAPRPVLEDLNVVLIVIDTLGSEYVGAYDDGDEASGRTPNIDRLAARGMRFERAYSTAPWTQPSVASLFTSAMPSKHGVLRITDRLSPHATTMAEELQARGFRTHGVISHVLLKRQFGYGQGFETYEDRVDFGHDVITSKLVSNASLQFLDEAAEDERPFFLFAHYFDPHYIYHDHEGFDQSDPSYQGRIEPGMSIWDLRDMRDELAPEDVDQLVGLYREEVAFTDHHIGRLLDGIEERGLSDSTLVILTADHGEEFMRHGWIGHTRTLFDELIRVPLIVSLPGAIEPGVVNTPVSIIDVLPTLLDLSREARRNPHQEGISLAPLLFDGERPSDSRRIWSEVSFAPGPQADEQLASKTAFKSAIVQGDLKLVFDHLNDVAVLFDLSEDPEELAPLSVDDHPDGPALRAALEDWIERRSDGGLGSGRTEPTADELDQLQKLGYLR